MARLTKKDLKGILKECLREILQEEGLLNSNSPLQEKTSVSKKTLNDVNSKQTNNFVDPSQIKSKALLESVNILANVVGGNDKNSLYARLLADTAVTTLQEQRDMEPNIAGALPVDSVYTQEQINNDTESLNDLTNKFSPTGDLNHWAKIAFAKKE